MNSTESIITRGTIALGSMGAYWLAQNRRVDNWYPFVIVGGLVGAVMGELILELTKPEKGSTNKNIQP